MIYSEHIAGDGETIAEICNNHYGDEAGIVEQVIRENPDLIGFTHLTAGDVVKLPKLTTVVSSEVVQVGLWD